MIHRILTLVFLLTAVLAGCCQVMAADATPPVLSVVQPARGAALSNLTQILVRFSEPVTGVDAGDLLINGSPALSVTNAGGTNFTFAFSRPAPGLVTVYFEVDHAITDVAGNRFDESAVGASWTYSLADGSPPVVAQVLPAPGATVSRLDAAEVTFSEPVTGVDAADLRVNTVPATQVSGSGAGPYRFTFPVVPVGTVTLGWQAAHGIRDAAGNSFTGAAWSVTSSFAATNAVVVINEFLASNQRSTGLKDEDNELADWLELVNRGAAPVNLLGWSLSNDPDVPGLWTFPSVLLQPGQFLVIYATGKDRRSPPPARLHTNFKLSPAGDYLALYNADLQRIRVHAFAPRFPAQRSDYSYGYDPAGAPRYFAAPSPGVTNPASTINDVAAPVEFSAGRGYYTLPFTLHLTTPTPGAVIRYTTDGSEPTAATGQAYGGPVAVSRTMVVRAAAFASNALPSVTRTHTYLFLNQVLAQSNNIPGLPSQWVSLGGVSVPADYELDPRVITNAAYRAEVGPALLSIPTLAVSLKPDDLFSTASGIYANPAGTGLAWERAASAEFLFPDGTRSEQIDAGYRIQGGSSRDATKTYKHSMRLLFRGTYGAGEWEYPLYADSPVTSFNTLVVDAFLNLVWNHRGDATQRQQGQYIRDQFVSDLFNAAGWPAFHGRYVHLVLNGVYWGLHDLHERPDASWAAAYYGGSSTNWDILKNTSSFEIIAGSDAAWNQMLALCTPGLTNIAQYEQLQQTCDEVNLIDYMIFNIWAGNTDWPHHNWYVGRERRPGATFKFFTWDAEHVLKTATDDRSTVNNAGTPAQIYDALRLYNPEFRLRFADRLQRHFFNGGLLYVNPAAPQWNPAQPANNRPAAAYLRRAAEINPAILLESARWGDTINNTLRPGFPYERNFEWSNELTRLVTTYFPARSSNVLNQFRSLGLYPAVAAPAFSQHGGPVAAGFPLTMTAPAGIIYYTTNGTDPRVTYAGTVAPGTFRYSNGVPMVIAGSSLVRARALSGTAWSALTEAAFSVGGPLPALSLTEIMFAPAGGRAFEYLELRNDGPVPLNAGAWTFRGIDFIFPAGTVIAPGQIVVLASDQDPAGFAARYPGVQVTGWFGGQLENSGERLGLLDASGRLVWSVTYGVDGAWPGEPASVGASLELKDPGVDGSAPAHWRSSPVGGTPGIVPVPPAMGPVVLSEVMALNVTAVPGDGSYPDWLELRNTGGSPVDLGGWSLAGAGGRFVIPSGTSLAPGAFLVVWCDGATNSPGLHAGFHLDGRGEGVGLFDAAGGRVDAVSFGLQVPDYSLARIGGTWVLGAPTPGLGNVATPVAGATNVAINEWLANPVPGADDWLELYNPNALPARITGILLGNGTDLDRLGVPAYLPPRGYGLLVCDAGRGADHLQFRLPAAAGSLVLVDDAGIERQRIPYTHQLEGVSQGRLPDGAGAIAAFPGSPSPGAGNHLAVYAGARLNELMAANESFVTNAAGHFADWIELHNPALAPFALGGFRLATSQDGAPGWTFPAGVVVAAGGHLVVWFDPLTPASTNLSVQPNTGRGLDRGGDGLFLFDERGQLVDSVRFGLQAPDLSLGRLDGDWRLLAQPSPGAVNGPAALLTDPAGLRFNEWSASSGDEDFVELYNAAASPVALGGLRLTDDLSVSGPPASVVAPLSFIGGRGFAVFHADGDPSRGPDHVAFRLDAGGDSLRLSDATGGVIDTVAFGAQPSGISQGRLPDGASVITNLPALTPGGSNLGGFTNVSVIALTTSVPESGGAGRFLVFRNAGTNGALAVAFSISGSAVPGTDYAPLFSPAVIPPGGTGVVVVVDVITDGVAEADETVVLSLDPGPGYRLGAASSAAITVLDDDNLPPVVAMTSPATGSLLFAATNVLLTASASDPEDSVARVEYRANGVPVGAAFAPPFAAVWAAPAGTHVLVARAVDGLGRSAESAPVTLVVNAPPTVRVTCPRPGEILAAPVRVALSADAVDPDGEVVRVEFFVDGSPVGMATRAPFAVPWDGAVTGSHVVTARATDRRGITSWSAPVAFVVGQPGPGSLFIPPAGGWTYLYDGVGVQGGSFNPSVALDGSWSANNSSSSWDGLGRGPGVGAPGGISSAGGILTIEDLNSGGATNRKIYFTRELSLDTATTNQGRILEAGITLTFRARLTQPDIQPPAHSNNLPDGWGLFGGAKAMFNVHQYNAGIHSTLGFSLVRQSEPDSSGFQFPAPGLTFNRAAGNIPGAGVDSTSVAAQNPVLPLNPHVFHEFWITIQTNRHPGSNGTHTVDIYVDGATAPFTANLTAGTGAERNTTYLGLGLNNSLGSGCFDVDFFGYRQGVVVPAAAVTSVAICSEPLTQLQTAGAPAVFAVQAAGSLPIAYQWRRDGVPLAGATNQTLRFNAVGNADAGGYSVVVSNPGGSVTSLVARLIIVTPPQLGRPSMSDGTLMGTVAGSAGTHCLIEASADLKDWQPLGVLPLSDLPVPFLDPSAALWPRRFYRATLVP